MLARRPSLPRFCPARSVLCPGLALAALSVPSLAWANEGPAAAHGGLPAPWTVVFFVTMLLCIAILPLTRLAGLWHSNLNKLIVGLVLSVYPVLWLTLLEPNTHILLETMEEYVSFIVLLGALFYISGGIYLGGDLRCTPRVNTTFLALGTACASVVGTTGASMLFIRPLLRANIERKYQVHVVVFFIFLVSNIGGSLLPLGDPPLFLGYLKGVPFLWTLSLWPYMLVMVVVLLAIFYAMDRHFYARETPAAQRLDVRNATPLRVHGTINLVWLLGIVLAAALIRPEHGLFVRELVMLGCCLASRFTTKAGLREKNEFSWAPILEVAALFVGIFLTMIPALMLLKASGGSLGVTSPLRFFWASGILSSFLDNAPTYLVFFNTAQGMVEHGQLAGALVDPVGVPFDVLIAISCGAVFMGANTYIGNGPNFMVKAIAEEQNVEMPSFFGYMRWSVIFLVPCFLGLTLLFFV